MIIFFSAARSKILIAKKGDINIAFHKKIILFGNHRRNDRRDKSWWLNNANPYRDTDVDYVINELRESN